MTRKGASCCSPRGKKPACGRKGVQIRLADRMLALVCFAGKEMLRGGLLGLADRRSSCGGCVCRGHAVTGRTVICIDNLQPTKNGGGAGTWREGAVLSSGVQRA